MKHEEQKTICTHTVEVLIADKWSSFMGASSKEEADRIARFMNRGAPVLGMVRVVTTKEV